jgi:hypothetical protein
MTLIAERGGRGSSLAAKAVEGDPLPSSQPITCNLIVNNRLPVQEMFLNDPLKHRFGA